MSGRCPKSTSTTAGARGRNLTCAIHCRYPVRLPIARNHEAGRQGRRCLGTAAPAVQRSSTPLPSHVTTHNPCFQKLGGQHQATPPWSTRGPRLPPCPPWHPWHTPPAFVLSPLSFTHSHSFTDTHRTHASQSLLFCHPIHTPSLARSCPAQSCFVCPVLSCSVLLSCPALCRLINIICRTPHHTAPSGLKHSFVSLRAPSVCSRRCLHRSALSASYRLRPDLTTHIKDTRTRSVCSRPLRCPCCRSRAHRLRATALFAA